MKPELNATIYYIDTREQKQQMGTLIHIQGVHMIAERADGFRDYVQKLTPAPLAFDI